jgi:chromosome segregation ATPase
MKGLLSVGSSVAVVVCLAMILATVASRVPVAQTVQRDVDFAEERAQTQALRDLVAEVRALRAVIESYTDGQARQQTLSDLLTVQQRRVSDATMRLDAVRRELDGVSSETRRLRDQVASFDDGLRRMTDTRQRADLEAQSRAAKDELDRATEQESQLRNRESETLSAVGFEEAKWNELVDRVNRTLAK